jgi:hypothetical protein
MKYTPLIAMLISVLLSACGGGASGPDTPDTWQTPPPQHEPVTTMPAPVQVVVPPDNSSGKQG